MAEFLQNYGVILKGYPTEEERLFLSKLMRMESNGYMAGVKTAYSDLAIKRAVTEKVISAEAKDWFRNNAIIQAKDHTSAIALRIKSRIMWGISRGESVEQIAKGLEARVLPFKTKVPETPAQLKRMLKLRARTIARTEVQRAYNRGRFETYKKEGVKKIRWVCGPKPCVLDPREKVLTKEGWKQIRDIEIGDLVLTHKDRWREVTEVMNRPYNDIRVTITTKTGNRPKRVTVTGEHPFLIQRENEKLWVEAKNLLKTDKIFFLANRCLDCL